LSRSDVRDQITERRISVFADRSNLIIDGPFFHHLSSDIAVYPIATNRIMPSGFVRFVPVNKRERERIASVPVKAARGEDKNSRHGLTHGGCFEFELRFALSCVASSQIVKRKLRPWQAWQRPTLPSLET
jgi:hypothetical protein